MHFGIGLQLGLGLGLGLRTPSLANPMKMFTLYDLLHVFEGVVKYVIFLSLSQHNNQKLINDT